MQRARVTAGMTLMEIMVTLAIVGLVMGGAVVGLRSLAKSDLRSTAGKLAGAIRYSYDRAISTGSFYRLHFRLDEGEQEYQLERSEARVFLKADKERAGRNGRGLDQDQEVARQIEEEERRSGLSKNLPKDLLPPPSPRKAVFEAFKDTALPKVKLTKIHILDVYTPRQEEPYVAGHAYLHFFPDGHTERAVIHLGTDREDEDGQYTLLVHGLTGRVEVKPGRVAPPRDFDSATEAVPK